MAQTTIRYAPFTPAGPHQVLDVTGTAAALAPATGANAALLQAIGTNIRYTIDGTTVPTPTTGFVLTGGADPTLIQLTATIRVIEESAGAVLQLQWGTI